MRKNIEELVGAMKPYESNYIEHIGQRTVNKADLTYVGRKLTFHKEIKKDILIRHFIKKNIIKKNITLKLKNC